MKIQKQLIVFTLVLFLGAQLTFAQEKEIEKMPTPKGGIKALMENVEYPEEAKKENIQGKVIVEAVIGVDGKVESATILKSENSALDNAALTAVKKTLFEPGMDKGKTVKAKVVIPIKFKLK
ncbi:MAG: energy transducer TonB [Melioribacteraceae bacterium]|nr:energy transducer TonB [Melioribacteraceae bacterium]MCF8263577.1 energy transducer TonB [Melioribacteraceae bacterium]MCF8412430.1 energy transducer TonB [Melioribacteraceae bacterium]MCF8430817.1 energy transducer TonB [Melioribacteraceae bacterium]